GQRRDGWVIVVLTVQVFLPIGWAAGYHRIRVIQDGRDAGVAGLQPVLRGVAIQANQPTIPGGDVNRQARGGVIAARIVWVDRAVRINERLHPCDVRVVALLVVNFNAYAELRGDVGGVEAELGGVRRHGGFPFIGIRDAADGHHDADVVTLEVVHDVRIYAARDAIHEISIRG